jgi:hypothetical protein
MNKTCAKCNIDKNVNEFYKNSSKKDKLNSWCKVCSNDAHYAREKVKQEKEKIKRENKRVEILNSKHKICTKCGKNKNFNEYAKSKECIGGVNSVCRNCVALMAEERRNKNPEFYKQYKKDWRKNHPEKDKEYNNSFDGRFNGWKSRARERKIKFTLTKEYLLSMNFKKCYYTGIDLTLESCKYNTISLDRIDSSKGYENGNVVFCCKAINLMKNETDLENFVLLCEKVAQNKNNILTNKIK